MLNAYHKLAFICWDKRLYFYPHRCDSRHDLSEDRVIVPWKSYCRRWLL